MKNAVNWVREYLAIAVVVTMAASAPSAWAADELPLAAMSPLSSVSFDDKPIALPVQRNFQMAMLTSGSELGRTCGRMEAYGWRMSQTEQARVNLIFSSTVDRLRGLGYTVAPQTLSSVSKDITLFTADRPDRHFIFLWSAGDLGLVMTLCETSMPLGAAAVRPTPSVPSVQVFNDPSDVVSSRLDALKNAHVSGAAFTPLGKWEGSYTCAQGYTGGTLQIDHVSGQDFDGVFKFYPTSKNYQVPAGSYRVYGQYDKTTNRVLINPGKWIDRPKHYYNTVMVGSFDAAHDTLSAFFQGISGCTSFEARHSSDIHNEARPKKKHKKASKHAGRKNVDTTGLMPAEKPVMPEEMPPAVGLTSTPMPAQVPAQIQPPAPAPLSGLAIAPTAVPAIAAPAPVAPTSLAPTMPAPTTAAPTSAVAPAAVAIPVPGIPATSAKLSDPILPTTIPAQTPGLPAEDKKDSSGIVLTAPAK